MTDSHYCNICFESTASRRANKATVSCNMRRFRGETFTVWRCSHCQSIHAIEDVDLEHYYHGYAFHHLELDWRMRAMYKVQLKRLRQSGLHPTDALLDYGCGGGLFVRYLHSRGIEDVNGFDAYDKDFNDRSVLDRMYSCVLSQDVIEHVAEPWDMLRELDGLTKSGGIVAIGTPNATGIDLRRPEDFIHTLHQPYHRHILSRDVLINSGKTMGWQFQRYYPTMYNNTLVPFVNQRFATHYLKCFGNTLDAFSDGVRKDSLRFYAPDTVFYAFFGYFLAPSTDGMAVFRKP